MLCKGGLDDASADAAMVGPCLISLLSGCPRLLQCAIGWLHLHNVQFILHIWQWSYMLGWQTTTHSDKIRGASNQQATDAALQCYYKSPVHEAAHQQEDVDSTEQPKCSHVSVNMGDFQHAILSGKAQQAWRWVPAWLQGYCT